MLRKTAMLVLIYWLLTDTTAWAAAQLQASVDMVQLALGETLTLKLELTEAANQDSRSEIPDLGPLQSLFTLHDQQTFKSIEITNNQTQQRIGWQYTLSPKKTGNLTIPALALKTQNGVLYSQPITITVLPQKSAQKKSNDDMYLETTISKPDPYLHEPIHYRLRLYHRGNLREIQPIPPSHDVITEILGKLTHRHEIIKGKEMIVSEVNYLLTPLRSGQLVLEPAQMQAKKLEKRKSRGSFSGRNFFDLDSDFFSFTRARPVTLNSEPLTLTVQAPPTPQQPWLPLKDLKLTQHWESDINKAVSVGVPLVRTLTLTAEGMGGQAPPALEELVPDSQDFRIRSPKPEITRNLLADGQTPVSTITQSFSLIPINTGKLHLPVIRIPWWDIHKQVLTWVELPEQVIEVTPNPMTSIARPQVTDASRSTTTALPVATARFVRFNWIQQSLFGIALTALVIALGYSWYQRRRCTIAPISQEEPARLRKAVFRQQLHASTTPDQLKSLLQTYAHLYWQTSAQASLRTLAHHVEQHYIGGNWVGELLRALDAALYGQATFAIDTWRQQFIRALDDLKQKERAEVTEPAGLLTPLNPSAT